MTELRDRMIQDMQLRGLAPGTQKTYVDAIRELAGHYHRCPDQLSEEDIRDYFIYLKDERHLAGCTLRTYLYAVKFLYRRTFVSSGPYPIVGSSPPKTATSPFGTCR